ncbi:MAG TPA: hypothetical protein PKV91_04705 [Bacillota bacterium]|jgi:hypothetical protein|nr:hypothetical protein [Bacillota bacterium]HOA35140.1 hypothetical protein [Bacillota bacterium]HOL15419.1 hypothetical protein [Bacillota bacterium]HPZ11640.1 hypothetical protein [Bacillota bacterium]HQE09493.1 hypothetical protein [Bacillota bacterium]
MRGRIIFLALLALLVSVLICRQFFLPQPVTAYNSDNLILQQEAAPK